MLVWARLGTQPEAQTRFEVVSHPEMFDGVRAHPGQVLAVIRHNARVLLSCERVILNLLQHLSGIATLTRKYADTIQGTHARVLDTRKTVPGMRALEKYAVLCGGGTNHRIDLASGILIKNNHIALGGGIAAVLKRALEQRQPGQRVQVEVRNAQELDEALAHGAEAILLDNMTPKEVKRSVERVKSSQPERWIPTEASGRHRARQHPRLRRDRRRLHQRGCAHPLRSRRRHFDVDRRRCRPQLDPFHFPCSISQRFETELGRHTLRGPAAFFRASPALPIVTQWPPHALGRRTARFT